LEFLGYI